MNFTIASSLRSSSTSLVNASSAGRNFVDRARLARICAASASSVVCARLATAALAFALLRRALSSSYGDLVRIAHHQHAEHAARGFVDVGFDGVGADGIRIAQVDQRTHLGVQAGKAGVRQAGQQDEQSNDNAKADGQPLADAQIIDVHRTSPLDLKKV